ncbi:hypothetical protein COS66_01455 [Candidatus Berkelbacteria bacterium CG06_land_8_20_14_3_00_43_10]|uniref:Solute-binding protein family 5 domain-containing protein n=1 Tax=Candidatus Berkelbacteria bacterium CG10_big_fil_rev_8_21_14_0_10_43_14 TaxID=1974515 RepID=A0A2M6R7P3_9BACT|nr:MAG: hypothetical protein COT79_03920 [Candidatus Berkelbacteria bacterium CG10_big_fil_rev_8_21_14_0_10_43_14]PIU87327.1 MAG: hypothetical protein COS66_01455 [Candidatus Berkelbacteria bacterium CG06_land_8_20_14_3_00_43_10]
MKLSLRGRLVDHLKRLPRVLTNGDRLILALASIVLFVGLIGLFMHSASRPNSDIPVHGGELVEGIVASSLADVDKEVDALTTIGLLRYNEKGEISPAIADSYTVSDDGLSYVFKIHAGVNDASLVGLLKDPSSGIGTDDVTLSENHDVTIKLHTPYSPLLGNLTKPLFPYGPYEVQKRSQSEILFTSRPDFVFGEPRIAKIRYKIYPSQDALNRALQQGEVLAGSGIKDPVKGFTLYTVNLQRKNVVLFNLDRDPWKQKELRSKIVHKETLAPTQKMVLTTLNDPQFLAKAQSLKDMYTPLGLDIEIRSVDALTMRDSVLAKRDFDVLLYGIDTGRDPDPFPFWHSSQIGGSGANVSGFINKEVDSLLEQSLFITNKDERQKKYDSVSKIIDEHAPVIYLDSTSVPYYASTKIQGIKMGFGISEADRYSNVWEWYLLTKRVFK